MLNGRHYTPRMRPTVLALALSSILATAHASPAPMKPGDYWVSVERVLIRAAPDPKAKETSYNGRGWKMTVFEVKNGWGRTSKYYDGSVDGLHGQIAEWVPMSALDTVQPPAETVHAGDPEVTQYLTGSDNFGKFRKVMIKASQDLIDKGTCTANDFKMNGAWFQMPEGGASQPVYFTYCGSMTSAGRVYLNVRTGKTYK